MSEEAIIKVRFAPSPTGPLHIGSARTALFNWIFAKSKGGKFILRIEDTDKERSDAKFEENIKTGLKWLGIEWDELYKQSERTAVYKKYIAKLLEEGWIYYCFCTKEELEDERQAMLSQGFAPKYSGRCRSMKKSDVEAKLKEGNPSILRFKVREAEITFKDLIRGTVSFNTSLIGDFVIAKDPETPLYNLAVVIDDALMGVTHVIRGEEHISNTPRQILVMDAFGFEIPKFAHLPIILNPDRSKMSKRLNGASLKEYIDKGYLKEAMVNFLAFLGWHPKDDRELLSIEEIIEEFTISRVQKGGAAFNIEKLNWFNSNYIKQLSDGEFIKLSKPFLPHGWKLTPAMIKSLKSRITTMDEVGDYVDFYFTLPNYDSNLLKWHES